MLPELADTRELLDQARQGDPAAVDRLLAQHREPLRRLIALRLDPALAGRLDASDVVQDVLLEASRRLHDYLRDPAMPFHLWLRHIARDHVIDAHRRHRKAQRRSLDREQSMVPAGLADRSSVEIMAQFFDPELTPASAAIQAEMRRRLEAAIASLDEHDREVILMKLYEQLSNQEVATVLGLSEAATSMRYLRAIRRLRAILVPRPGSQSESE
jgi:RNA polymerase sigma-70 factor (ECF subfamily)